MTKFISAFPGPGKPDFSVEVPVRAFEPERPFPRCPTAIVYRTRYQQLRAFYSRPQPGAAHPNVPQAYFGDDVEFQDRLNGMVEWTRVWTTLPQSWNDYEPYSYSYPGYVRFSGPNSNAANIGRVEFTQTVTSKLPRDYFLVGTLPTFSNNVANYDDFNNASWIKSGATTSANAKSIPISAGGTTTAAKIIESNTNAAHVAYQQSGPSGLVACCAFISPAGRNRGRVALYAGTNLVGDCILDMLTGNFTETLNANCNIAAIGDGWWRVTMTGNCNANANVSVGPALDDNSFSYQGDGASGIYAWRGQIAPGGTIPHCTVPPTVTVDNTNYPLNTPDDIPPYFALRYFYAMGFNTIVPSIGTPSTEISGLLTGLSNLTFATNSNTAILWGESIPSLTNYNNNVTNDAACSVSYSIEADGSLLTQLAGSCFVWERKRRNVKAR